tara:strand:- start:257 stop:1105 length:849 start_codon:yes stop_codon:yes gene_type:complete
MSFNYIAAISALECKNFIKSDSPNAIDLGFQTPSIEIDKFIEYLLKNKKTISDSQITNLNKIKDKNFSTRDFFTAINFKDYAAIDINGVQDSYQYDLNFNIEEKYNFKNQYDLVINNGTGEHVFNQFSLFENFHNLTKKNGIMLNILPFIDWINHGFYNFNPILFADLSAGNDYEIIKISFANRMGSELDLKKEDHLILFEQIKPSLVNTAFANFIDLAKKKLGANIILKVITKKNNDLPFQIPLQGKYLHDIENINSNYSDQKKGSSGALNQISDGAKRNL